MKPPVLPLAAGEVNGYLLRFFRSPNTGPDMPWHDHHGLMICLGLPRDLRRELLAKARAFDKGELRSIATLGEVVQIAPHAMALGLIAAAEQRGLVTGEFLSAYGKIGGEALTALQGDLPLDAALRFSLDAFRNAMGGPV